MGEREKERGEKRKGNYKEQEEEWENIRRGKRKTLSRTDQSGFSVVFPSLLRV